MGTIIPRLAFTGIAFGGEAIARHEGKAIFVPFALPGDVAAVELVEDRGRFARGRLTQLITPSPQRITPRCKHFGICGGCHWQHIPYPLQLEYKTQIVREQLARIGGIPAAPVLPTLGADDAWHYRNNVQFHVTRDGRLGFMAARTNTVVPIEECHIMQPPVEALWRELELELPDLVEVTLRAGIHTGERLAALRLDGDEAPEGEIDLAVNCVVQLADDSEVVLAGDDHFHETLAGHTFQVSVDSFFQVNTAQAEKLVALVVQAVRTALASDSAPSAASTLPADQKFDAGAGLASDSAPNAAPTLPADQQFDAGAGLAPDLPAQPVANVGAGHIATEPAPDAAAPPAPIVILDAYCGVGTFALALAPLATRVIAIEGAPSAVRDARVNTQAFPTIEIVEGAVETILPALDVSPAVAVLDPPREGCASAVLDALSSRRVPHIVYVSCDPSTFARDVKRLGAAGYTLVSVQPLDLFPQTFHIETVALLARA